MLLLCKFKKSFWHLKKVQSCQIFLCAKSAKTFVALHKVTKQKGLVIVIHNPPKKVFKAIFTIFTLRFQLSWSLKIRILGNSVPSGSWLQNWQCMWTLPNAYTHQDQLSQISAHLYWFGPSQCYFSVSVTKYTRPPGGRFKNHLHELCLYPSGQTEPNISPFGLILAL